jgi:dihydroflavonol-4-reductase
MDQPWTLVTGASGFIGSRLARLLVQRGERVKAFVRAESKLGALAGLPADRFRLAVGDIRVEHSVYAALAGCHRMYHVAANFKLWAKRPEQILDAAIEGTRATLSAAKKRGLEKVVATSSAVTLGATSKPEPMDEDQELRVDDPDTYVRAKYEAEQLALEMADEHGLPLVVVLPSSVVGPGDWKPTPTGAGILRYLKLSPNLRVPLPDGGVNIVDVDDVALGHVLAMEKGEVGERYILGGEDLSYEELVDTLSDLTDLAMPGRTVGPGLFQLAARYMELRARLGGPQPTLTYRMARDYVGAYAFVTSEKAERELGYRSRPAREALGRAIRWYLENGYVPERAARRVRLELRPT